MAPATPEDIGVGCGRKGRPCKGLSRHSGGWSLMRRPMFPPPRFSSTSPVRPSAKPRRGCAGTRRTMELLTPHCDPTVTLRGALVRY